VIALRSLVAACAAVALSAVVVMPENAETRIVMAGSSSGGTAHLYFASLAPLLN
jgi:cephalosporin-C deacetylase-like acetyl esterase